jgi:hypothetical protein
MISAEHVFRSTCFIAEVCMSQGALISWKEECDAIHREMDRLLAGGWLETAEERQVRKIQFMALIAQRNVAAQNFLKSNGEMAGLSVNQEKLPETSEVLPNADQMFEVDTMKVKINQEPSEAPLAIDRSSEVLPADPICEAENMNVNTSQEPSEAALAINQSSQAPPARPRFEIMNFLKFLELK